MKKIIVSLTVFLALADVALSQDLNFSQFYETPLLRNPALAGIFKGDIRVKASYRSQWASVTVPYNTTALSAEYKMPLNNAVGDWVTLGMQVTNDVAGSIKLRKTSLLPVISFNKSLSQENDSYLSIAFIGGPVSTQFNPSELSTHQSVASDPALLNSAGYTYWDMGAGLTYSSNYGDDIRYYLGAAMYHINNPKLNYFAKNDFSILGRKLLINGGITAQTSDNNKIIAYADYIKQEGSDQFLAGMLYGIELSKRYEDEKTIGLNLGAMFRWNDALIPVVNLDIYDWTFGLSYDVNISRLATYSQYRGGTELSLTYRATLNRRTAAGNAVRCPGF